MLRRFVLVMVAPSAFLCDLRINAKLIEQSSE